MITTMQELTLPCRQPVGHTIDYGLESVLWQLCNKQGDSQIFDWEVHHLAGEQTWHQSYLIIIASYGGHLALAKVATKSRGPWNNNKMLCTI